MARLDANVFWVARRIILKLKNGWEATQCCNCGIPHGSDAKSLDCPCENAWPYPMKGFSKLRWVLGLI